MVYLRRAVDQDGEILESYIARTRDKDAALSFMKRMLKRHGSTSCSQGLRKIVNATQAYGAAQHA